MKLIPLSQGLFAMVDDDDYDYLMQWKWYARKTKYTYYATRCEYSSGKQVQIQLHRSVLRVPPEIKNDVDHVDRNGLNCMKSNLRLVTNAQNQMNKSGWGKSKFKGVCWHKATSKFLAQISINKKRKHLGLFENEIDAAKAYNECALQNFGEYAFLNQINN